MHLKDVPLHRYGDRIYETQMELGEVGTTEDMLLVFPNFLQHKVSDFKLIDETKPGSRKILCFFLINPYEQYEQVHYSNMLFAVYYLYNSVAKSVSFNNFCHMLHYSDRVFLLFLPQVLSTAHVAPQQDNTSGAMTLEDAQMYRELLMFQRKYEIDDQTQFFERGWSLCEH